MKPRGTCIETLSNYQGNERQGRPSDLLIWRRIEMPTSIMLKVLRDIIQAVMGWSSLRVYEEFTRSLRRMTIASRASPPNCQVYSSKEALGWAA
jgi:hypothetical protein